MRRLLAVSILVLSCLLAGCVNDAVKLVNATGVNRLKPKAPEVAPDLVEIHYIFIEREEGNKLLNEGIWAEADEQAVGLELKSHLQRNGLRFGRLGSRLSAELIKLLENSNSSGEGRRHQTKSGMLAKVETTGVVPDWNLFTVIDGQPKGENLTNAQGYLYITPTIEQANAVGLAIVPVVEYGEREAKRIPAPDLNGWQLKHERPAKVFSELKTEVELASGEYALIGCWPEAKGTIGQRSFIKEQGNGSTRQTVLLVRVVRPSGSELYTAGYQFDDFFLTPTKKRGEGRSAARETVLATRPTK